jgi:hypothetical protein
VLFKNNFCDWVDFRQLPDLTEIDMHWAREDAVYSYYENMERVAGFVQSRLEDAQQQGRKYVMLRHGHSTSRIGKTTTRSEVRKFMRSKEATPLIIRKDCIQHSSVFVAAIRPLPQQSKPR